MSIEAIKHYEAALLEAFPRGATGNVFEHWNKARIAIAEAEKQEPVACPYCKNWATLGAVYYDQNCAGCVKRMTHPQPQRTWVGLTDEEIDQGLCRTPYAMKTAEAWREGVRWAYHQLKEKNT